MPTSTRLRAGALTVVWVVLLIVGVEMVRAGVHRRSAGHAAAGRPVFSVGVFLVIVCAAACSTALSWGTRRRRSRT